MIEIIKFCTRDFWTFLACLTLIAVVLEGFASIIKALLLPFLKVDVIQDTPVNSKTGITPPPCRFE